MSYKPTNTMIYREKPHRSKPQANGCRSRRRQGNIGQYSSSSSNGGEPGRMKQASRGGGPTNSQKNPNVRELVSWSQQQKQQPETGSDTGSPQADMSALAPRHAVGVMGAHKEKAKVRGVDDEEVGASRRSGQQKVAAADAAALQSSLGTQGMQLFGNMKEDQEQRFSEQDQLYKQFKLQIDGMQNQAERQNYKLVKDQAPGEGPISSHIENIEIDNMNKYKIQDTYKSGDLLKQSLYTQNQETKQNTHKRLANCDRSQFTNKSNTNIRTINQSTKFDKQRVNSTQIQDSQNIVSALFEFGGDNNAGGLDFDDLFGDSPGLPRGESLKLQSQQNSGKEHKPLMNPETQCLPEAGKELDDFTFDLDGLNVEQALKEQLLKQQASTAQPKQTTGSRFIDENLKSGRRERIGRSHAPGKQKEGSAAGTTQVIVNPALLLDSKLTGNLSSEKTSATGSNGSHGSPQHTLTGKGRQLGATAAARKLFTLQNAEATNSKKKDSERQPLYLQMMARNGTQTLSSEQAPAAAQPSLGDLREAHDNFEDLELELDGEQEQMWEQSMSRIIGEMRVQLQLDLNGQQSAGVASNAFDEVMDQFIESQDFERALSFRGGKRRNRGGAKSGQGKQKIASNGGSMKQLHEILQGRHQAEDVTPANEQEALEAISSDIFNELDALDGNVRVPTLHYEKSFLRRIPSIIPEAHESIISLRGEESPAKNGMTQDDLTNFINQVHQESAQSAQSCNGNSAAEEANSSQNGTSHRQDTKKSRPRVQQKFFEKSACFDVPSAQDVPVDLFE